jgi:hypothetical protein
MSEARRGVSRAPRSLSSKERQEYDLLLLVERLESLVEEMDDLGVTTRIEAEAKIAELHERLDTEA